jgi:hypothetical protein
LCRSNLVNEESKYSVKIFLLDEISGLNKS